MIGSQAILGAFDDDELPDSVKLSREADIAFLDDPTREKADAVEGAIGEMSAFHDANRVYAEGVHIDTAELPEGWRGRPLAGTFGPAIRPRPGSSNLMTWFSASSPPARGERRRVRGPSWPSAHSRRRLLCHWTPQTGDTAWYLGVWL